MSDPGSLIGELQRVAVSLNGTDPERPLPADAADVLRNQAVDASIVALGETSHGARAQFRLKQRLIRFLVEELDLRAFALETDANWARRIDTSVTDGENDIEKLLRNARVNWPWKTAELVRLFEWMREFNKDQPEEDQIRVYGFDVSSFDRIAAMLSTFFDTVDADVPAVRAKLEILASEDENAAADVAESLSETLPALFDDHAEWSHHCSSEALAFARRQPVLLAQALELHEVDAEDAFAIRDAAMATNTQWIVNNRSAERAVLWGHNIHIARVEQSEAMMEIPGQTMGDQLADRYGEDYVPIGIGLGSGEYLALDAETMDLATPSVPTPPVESIPDVFLQLETATPFVSTTRLQERDPIVDWLATGPCRHRISGMIEDDESLTYVASDLSEFDGFAFVDTTDPIHHLGLDDTGTSSDEE